MDDQLKILIQVLADTVGADKVRNAVAGIKTEINAVEDAQKNGAATSEASTANMARGLSKLQQAATIAGIAMEGGLSTRSALALTRTFIGLTAAASAGSAGLLGLVAIVGVAISSIANYKKNLESRIQEALKPIDEYKKMVTDVANEADAQSKRIEQATTAIAASAAKSYAEAGSAISEFLDKQKEAIDNQKVLAEAIVTIQESEGKISPEQAAGLRAGIQGKSQIDTIEAQKTAVKKRLEEAVKRAANPDDYSGVIEARARLDAVGPWGGEKRKEAEEKLRAALAASSDIEKKARAEIVRLNESLAQLTEKGQIARVQLDAELRKNIAEQTQKKIREAEEEKNKAAKEKADAKEKAERENRKQAAESLRTMIPRLTGENKEKAIGLLASVESFGGTGIEQRSAFTEASSQIDAMREAAARERMHGLPSGLSPVFARTSPESVAASVGVNLPTAEQAMQPLNGSLIGEYRRLVMMIKDLAELFEDGKNQ
jgi:hypothetical protein